MIRASRRFLLAALCCALPSSIAAGAPVLAPSALAPLPDVVGPRPTLVWAPALGTPGSVEPIQYDVEVTDYSTGQTTGKTVTATSLLVSLTADHQYGFRIRAWQSAAAGGQFDREYSTFTEDIRVWVDAAPPIPAVALSAAVVDLGAEVIANASATTDGTASPSTSGVDVGEDATFDWSWGDGSPIEHGSDSSHVYERAGTYVGRLTVRDRAGNAAEAAFQVTVRPQGRIQGLAPLGLTRLRVPGRLVARRAGIVDVRASRAARLVVTISRLRPGRAAVLVRRFPVAGRAGRNQIPFVAPPRGNYLLSVMSPGRAASGLTTVVQVHPD